MVAFRLSPFALTRREDVIAITCMKVFTIAISMGLVGLLVGCVSTVNERTTAGMPFVKDKIEGRYERPVTQVFEAAKEVVKDKGVLVREGTLYSTNEVKTVEGRINQRNVWIRVTAVDPKVTSVLVQARTSGGGADVDLAAQVDKEIALKLR